MIIKIEIEHEKEQGERTLIAFEGDELTSPIHDAQAWLGEQLENEMVI
jgi:hypothetical protein